MTRMINKTKLYWVLLAYALLVIPLVHWVAPFFQAAVPDYVATESGSIIGQTNVYAQLAPYLIAYLTAPIVFFFSVFKLVKSYRKVS